MYGRLGFALAVLAVGLTLSACGGGGGGSSDSGSSSVSGFSVPTEISAVPTNQSVAVKTGLLAKLTALAATDPGTDYSNAVTVRYVEERTLEQFEIIGEIMKALAQTHYDDPSNVNQGPYKAMIAWQDERDGVQTKTLEPWVVDSSMIEEDGQDVNRVQVWIEEVDDGTLRLIKAEMKIYASATQADDGSYLNYGVWKLNAKMDEDATDFFVADASIGSSGESIIRLHENHTEGWGNYEVKAILNKSATEGFGKVYYPDWNDCMGPDCTPPNATAQYAYDADHLAVQKEGNPVQFKDRNTVTEMTHRYGLFDTATGEDVRETKSFGFPLQYTDNGLGQYAYYGAWQGRHQLWAGEGNAVPAGTVVTRMDYGSNDTPETFTVSVPFVGILTKRTPIEASVSDLLNIPVETWAHINFMLLYDGAEWDDCRNPDYSSQPPVCGAGSATFTDFNSLVDNPNDNRKHISVYRWVGNVNFNYVYDPAGPSGAGLYEATSDSMGNWISNGVLFTPSTGDQLWVNVGGSIYIEYTGTGATGWVEKTLLAFNEQTWTPEFDPNGDMEYNFPLDMELYINNNGANYIVKQTGPGVFDVTIELQTVANPVNVATFLPAGTIFKPQWSDTGNSTYRFVTDSADPKFLKLVYETVGPNDSTLNVNVGDVVEQGMWGLMAYENNVSTGVQYNWEYPQQGANWGTQTFLIDSIGDYKMLDDPIRMNPTTLTTNGGDSKTLSLQYDGWMHGLPNLYEELRANDYVMSADIADKVINIPAGTQLDDAADSSKHYLVKPLEISQFLNMVSDPGTLDISAADAVDLSTVPDFVEHNMGPMPEVTGVKYSEGVLIE